VIKALGKTGAFSIDWNCSKNLLNLNYDFEYFKGFWLIGIRLFFGIFFDAHTHALFV
jgi:hypothetical protein